MKWFNDKIPSIHKTADLLQIGNNRGIVHNPKVVLSSSLLWNEERMVRSNDPRMCELEIKEKTVEDGILLMGLRTHKQWQPPTAS